MRIISFLKMFKIESKFRKWKKKFREIFLFWDRCIRKCCNKLPLLRREYLSSAVKGLTDSSRYCISLREIFSTWIAFAGINKYYKMCCRPDINSFLSRLPCYLSKFRMKRDFLDIYLTASFRLRKFKNPSAMKVIFFWKCSNLNPNLQNTKRN